MRRFFLDASDRYNHGCTDTAIFQELPDNESAICIFAYNCTNCWQVGHSSDHVYAVKGEIVSISYLLNHPDLILDWESKGN